MKNDSRLIEKYLLGELQDPEKQEFEKRLQSDEALFAEYLLRKEVNDALLEKDIMQLRQSIQTIMNNKKTIMGFRFGRFLYWQLAAAVVIAFVVVKFIFFNSDKPIDSAVLFAKYYQACHSYQVSRKENTQSGTSLLYTQALTNYENRNFLVAEKSFGLILESDSTEIMARFYLAITQIELNKLAEAKENLSWLTQHKSHLFYEQSLWYMALVNLKEDRLTEAEQLLNIIIDEDCYCSKQAKKLLRKLN
jgi:hypothetical protein